MITKIQHRFTSQPRPRTITETIVIHHTASHDVSASEINRWHQNNSPPWLGIGYHFVVRIDGTIETGRPHNTVGAHAGANVNTRSIGVAVTGNFSQPEQQPTQAQMNSLVWLVQYLRNIYGQHVTVTRHSDHLATQCPGLNFPWNELKQKLRGGDENMTATPNNIPAKWAQTAWNWGTENNLTDGTRPTEAITRQEMITILHRFYERFSKCKH